MNPVGFALEKTAAIAATRDELATIFNDEWRKVEFREDAQAVVVGVKEMIAREWFIGDRPDVDLCLNVTDPPECVWWACLPRRDEVRVGISAARSLYLSGARTMCFQTHNLALLSHARKNGWSMKTLDCGSTRVFLEPLHFSRWLRSMFRE